MQTRAGDEGCGLEGDFLGWKKSVEEEQWTLHSKARWVDLDGGLESPCMENAKIDVFPMNEDHDHSLLHGSLQKAWRAVLYCED